MYLSDIRAAIAGGQRPTAQLLNDAYAGHRKWWDSEWEEDPILVNVWTEWDYILMRVFQYIQDYTTQNGHLIWVEDDPDVMWQVDRRASFHDRELHKYRESNEVKPWETLRAKPEWADDVEPPSMEKWLKALEADQSEPRFPDGAMGGRPPTPEELAALNQAQG